MLTMLTTSRVKTVRANKMLVIASSIFALLLLGGAPAPTLAAVNPVLTYKNASTTLGQLVTSSTLVWETYEPKDPKQLQYAVEGGKYVTDEEHYPIYVCRVTIDGVPTSGHTEKILQRHACVAAHYKHERYDHFDLLLNKGHLGKVGWKHWRKFSAGIPVGAIRIGDDAYIGRRRAHSHHHHHHHHHHQQPQEHHDEQQQHQPMEAHTTAAEEPRGADYNLGRLEQVGLGKIRVIENGRERDYDEGEVLIETEPFRYELHDIKLNKIRMDVRENVTDLGSSILVNRGDTYSVVETVISYEYDYVQYWGAHEGTARGLHTTVYDIEPNKPTDINWGLKHSEKRYETKSVHTKLWPGTALNVTLRGTYVTLEAPYTAKLAAFYYGSEESVSRRIASEVRKSYMKDIKLDFGPVYWIENGTIVPTTTTTTTTTSTTARTTTAASTNEPTPMNEPPIVHLKDHDVNAQETSLHDSPAPNEDQDQLSNEIPENLSEQQVKTAQIGMTSGAGAANLLTKTTTTTTTIAGLIALGVLVYSGAYMRQL